MNVISMEPLLPRPIAIVGERPLLHCTSRPGLRLAQYGLISAAIGVGIVLIVSLNQPELLNHRQILGGVVMGLSIGVGSIITEFLVLAPLLRLGLKPVLVARSVTYFAGGAAGFWVGMGVAQYLFRVDESFAEGRLVNGMLLYGVVAVGVGLSFHRVQTLQGALAEKEAELLEKVYAERELEMARQIQKRLMPPEQASGAGFSLVARNRAASIVAGDFYDYFRLPDGSRGFVIADVAGKGIGASLQMATVKAVLPLVAAARVESDNPVAGTLEDLNERLCGKLGPREFVALLYGRFDPEAGSIEMANAGLPDPYWITEEGDCEEPVQALVVEGERLPLGIRRGVKYQGLALSADEKGTLVLFTDGMVERTAGDGPLGYERFEAILAELGPVGAGAGVTAGVSARATAGAATEPSTWLDRLQTRLDAESGSVPEDDDCTVMVIQCQGSTSEPRALDAEPK